MAFPKGHSVCAMLCIIIVCMFSRENPEKAPEPAF